MSDYVPGLAGVVATKSKISDIDGEKGILFYRGYSIEDLAANSTYEETAMLLYNGELPNADELAAFDQSLKDNRYVKWHIRELMKTLPESAHPMDMLQTAVASLSMFYPGNKALTDSDIDNNIAYINSMTMKIIARMATIVAMWQHMRHGYDSPPPREDMGYAENFMYMLHRQEVDPLLVRIMDVCLILHAEHTINASTFSALVTGSTLATPYAVIAAAIGTLSGPLHGAANERVLEMLDEIGSADKVEAYVDERLANKEVIWGMGHREYKTKDPRAKILQGLLHELKESRGGEVGKSIEIAEEVERVVEDRLAHKGVYPNVDFYSGILYRELGIPPDQFTAIFAIARSAGWLAHWREQLENNRIFRPTQIYDGHGPRSYTPIDQR